MYRSYISRDSAFAKDETFMCFLHYSSMKLCNQGHETNKQKICEVRATISGQINPFHNWRVLLCA